MVAVATLACSLVTVLGLLVTTTEEGGVRRTLDAVPADRTAVRVTVDSPTGTVAETRDAIDRALRELLGETAGATPAGSAVTAVADVGGVAAAGSDRVLAYAGEYDDRDARAELVAGSWGSAPGPSGGGELEAAVPEAAASALGLGIGSTLEVEARGDATATVRVVGLYRAVDPGGATWLDDPLQGRGDDAAFPEPDVSFADYVHAIGPLIVADGALDAADVRVETLDLTMQPTFDRVTVAGLDPLVARLGDADAGITRAAGDVGQSVTYSSGVAEAVAGASAALTVTRATVAVAGLLLAVLALAAITQAGRLLADARDAERRLLAARGASRRQVIALAGLEAGVLGALVAGISPLVAAFGYRGLAALPAMRAAGMPTSSGVPVGSVLTAVAVAALLAAVLLAPALRRVDVEDPTTGRAGVARLARSGIDLALLVLAGLGIAQLVAYRSASAGDDAPAGLDPILVAAPVVVLVAVAALAVRLVPLVARGLGALAASARGSVLPLAAWELARRGRRATAAVLLLSLALAVCTFGVTFLHTWRISQEDQAAVAVGPTARVVAEPDRALGQSAALAAAAGADATTADAGVEPVLRRPLRIDGAPAGDPAEGGVGTGAQVLGLSAGARAMIADGRGGAAGGERIEELLRGSSRTREDAGVALPDGTRGLAATVRAGDAAAPLADVRVRVAAVVEDPRGLLAVVDLGDAPADGSTVEVAGAIDDGDGASDASGDGAAAPGVDGLRLVGIRTEVVAGRDADTSSERAAEVLVGGIAARAGGGADPADPLAGTAAVPLEDAAVADAVAGWGGVSVDPTARPPVVEPAPPGWQVRLPVLVPPDASTRTVVTLLLAWVPVGLVDAVIPSALADGLGVDPGMALDLAVSGVRIPVTVAGDAPLVPGSATSEALAAGASGLAGAGAATTVVVDGPALARALIQRGATGAFADEWWAGSVPRGDAASGAAPVVTRAGLARDLQEAPLRVATPTALLLAIVAAGILAAAGFALHTVASLRARRADLAHLRAVGVPARGVVGLVAIEALILTVLGACAGIAAGLATALAVGPLVAVSPGGTAPVPAVEVHVPWLAIALLPAGLAVVLALVVAAVARAQQAVRPAELLRAGGGE
ncbi:FtsX-like permease family protein [Clavibacter michiganensis]|uniref:FtsX-like permease family protein n=1 Tax=Clavibacter michiganensis TaxID=28447 RepID=A0A251Y193_9MICO|nr:ABC transporter permease [Clavibacter michiganensis]OUE18082.1 FtsX-like permease family protein [Clavibacter michiganensis]